MLLFLSSCGGDRRRWQGGVCIPHSGDIFFSHAISSLSLSGRRDGVAARVGAAGLSRKCSHRATGASAGAGDLAAAVGWVGTLLYKPDPRIPVSAQPATCTGRVRVSDRISDFFNKPAASLIVPGFESRRLTALHVGSSPAVWAMSREIGVNSSDLFILCVHPLCIDGALAFLTREEPPASPPSW